MKLTRYLLVLLSATLASQIAIANEEDRYWFYETAIEGPVESSYTVRLKEDQLYCEDSEAVTSEEDEVAKQEVLFNCIYDKGWRLSTVEAMEKKDGYFVIELCIFKEGKITDAAYFQCRQEGALPFKMAYASEFTPATALSDAITRFEILRGGGSLPE